jgi:hypothetical protein
VDSGHIFLSYSTTDRLFAEDLLGRLEAKGVKVWIAPRDVRPGCDYSEELQDAIESSAAVVALISDDANRSRHVRAEIEIAFSRGKPLFPVRFEDIVPARGLALFLGLGHWTDLFGPHEVANLDRLAAELSHRPTGTSLRPAPPRPPSPAPRPMPVAPPPRASATNRAMIVTICLSLVVIAGVLVLALMRNGASATGAPEEEVASADSGGAREGGTSPFRLAGEPAQNSVPPPEPLPPVEEPIPAPEPVPQPGAPAGSDWIVGAWALAGESCSGRQGATYMRDGRWDTAGGGGTWSIEGTSLVNTTYYVVRQGNRVPRNPPSINRFEALSFDARSISMRFPDGTVRTLYRCS